MKPVEVAAVDADAGGVEASLEAQRARVRARSQNVEGVAAKARAGVRARRAAQRPLSAQWTTSTSKPGCDRPPSRVSAFTLMHVAQLSCLFISYCSSSRTVMFRGAYVAGRSDPSTVQESSRSLSGPT